MTEKQEETCENCGRTKEKHWQGKATGNLYCYKTGLRSKKFKAKTSLGKKPKDWKCKVIGCPKPKNHSPVGKGEQLNIPTSVPPPLDDKEGTLNLSKKITFDVNDEKLWFIKVEDVKEFISRLKENIQRPIPCYLEPTTGDTLLSPKMVENEIDKLAGEDLR